MKNLVIALVVILCLGGFLRLPIAGAAGLCSQAIDFGYLDLDNVDQVETSWCWVASANAVTNHFGLTDPATSNLYTKCRLYNIAKNPSVDCCTNTSAQECQQSGWPWDVFQKLTPRMIEYLGEYNPMVWSEIQAQICPNWSLGRPFIFIAAPHTGGLPHTHVVKGFAHDIVGAPQLLIDDHYGWGAKFIEYECKYKLPANCQASGAQWDRVGDLYNLHIPGRIHRPDWWLEFKQPEVFSP